MESAFNSSRIDAALQEPEIAELLRVHEEIARVYDIVRAAMGQTSTVVIQTRSSAAVPATDLTSAVASSRQ